MKKNRLFGGMLLLAATFTACTEDFTDWAKPIVNPEPEAITIPGIEAQAAANEVDLSADGDAVKLVNVSAANAPEGTTLDKMRIVITPLVEGELEAVTLTAVNSAEGTFSKEDLQNIVVSNFGRRPEPRPFTIHVYLDGIYNGQAAYIDAGTVNLNLIPEAPFIAENYYIVGGPNDWAGSAASKQLKFQHSGADVYEDPVFSIIFDAAAEGDTWFAIGDDEGCDAIAGGDWSKLFGIVGGENDATTGSLDYRYNMGADNSFKVAAGARRIKVVIDMMERTFQVTPITVADNYYIVGGPNDWAGSAASKQLKFSHSDKDVSDDPVFTIIFDAKDGEDTWFAIGDDDACDAIANDGDWSKLYGTTAGNGNSGTSGTLARRSSLSDDGSFKVPVGPKRIKVTINMAELTYLVEPVNVADNYYIVGGPNDWATSAATKQLKFSHSDKDVSEDPVFSIIFNAAAEGDTWFAIGDDEACDAIANDGNWSKLYGTTAGNGQSGTSGSLDRRSNLSDDGSFMVPGGSKYIKVTINMAELTYEIQTINFEQFIYFIGATDGWNNDNKERQRLESAARDGFYTGYIYMADPNGWGNEFKFQKTLGDWGTEVNFGQMTGGVTGDLVEGGGGNFKANAGEGVYYVELDLSNNTLKGTRITNMNLVGDFNGWNPADNAQQMTWNATDYCFEITGAGVTAAGWKFTANNDWGINLGGDTLDNLVANGSNISAVGTTIKLYPTRKTSDTIYCTVQ